MRNPEGPKGPEQSTEAEKWSPDTGAERETGPEAQRATQDLRDISRSLTSADRLLTSSVSLKELKDGSIRETLQTKHSGLNQRLKKLSAVALAGMVSIGALLQGGAEGRTEGRADEQGHTKTDEAVAPDVADAVHQETNNATLTDAERAELLNFVLAISEQLRQGQETPEAAEPVADTAPTTELPADFDEDWNKLVAETPTAEERAEEESEPSSDSSDPFSEAYQLAAEKKFKDAEMERTIAKEQAEQGQQEMEDHAADQVMAYVQETLATNPDHFAKMLQFALRNGQYHDLNSIDEAPNRGVEQDLFDKKMAEALINLRTDVEGKMRSPGVEMTEAERKIAVVLAEEERRKTDET